MSLPILVQLARSVILINAVAAADVVFVDPDNGLETGVNRYSPRGPKFVYYDDLIPLAGSGKSLIIYQHAVGRAASTIRFVVA